MELALIGDIAGWTLVILILAVIGAIAIINHIL